MSVALQSNNKDFFLDQLLIILFFDRPVRSAWIDRCAGILLRQSMIAFGGGALGLSPDKACADRDTPELADAALP